MILRVEKLLLMEYLLCDFDTKSIRRRVSVVFQDYAKYYLTVRENIWLGDNQISRWTQRKLRMLQKW